VCVLQPVCRAYDEACFSGEIPACRLLVRRFSRGGGRRGGDGDGVTFAPVFNFYGNPTKEQAMEAGRVSFAEFKRLYKQMKAEERRKSFSPA